MQGEGIMEVLNTVFETAEKFMADPQHVTINEENLEKLASDMKQSGVTKFPNELGLDDIDTIKEVKLELLASSINYCYWYGRADVRPCDASSTMMYDLLKESYEAYGEVNMEMIAAFRSKMSLHRFPMIEDRAVHLIETFNTFNFLPAVINEERDQVEYIVKALVVCLPGFASDIFLKRASLFCMQLNRKLGWYEETMNELPVPADYQVPKMLRGFGTIQYGSLLSSMIERSVLIPKYSILECEIRAATIMAVKKLSEILGWASQEIDSWLWLRRKACEDPFHLTVTTDY
jgi:hypothetical protein